ncbi:MAG TPA: hypothetical protein VFT55_09765 [Planctomycetota bacterium]|nr:hypothetical protein [Planctomycetota bacterium]
MRTFTLPFVVLAVALGPASAQSLQFAQQGSNMGNVGGGFYFDLTCSSPVTLTHLHYVAALFSPPGNSSVDILLGPSTWVGNVAVNPGPWTLAGTTAAVAIPGGVDTAVTGVILGGGPGPGITLAAGTYGIALRAVGHNWRYENGATTFADPNVAASFGGASNTFLNLPTFSPRVLVGSLDYVIGGPGLASVAPYGKGCYARYRSFYEWFQASTGFDLSNTSMYLAFDPVGNRYVAVAGTTPVVPPSSPPLGLGDNQNLAVVLGPAGTPQPIVFPGPGGPATVTAVEMCSNLYVNLLGTTPPFGVPSVQAWLNGGSVRVGTHRAVRASLGATHYEYHAGSGAHLFTWLAVPDAVGTGTNTFQLACFGNGDLEFRWGAISTVGSFAAPTLVGFTTGGGALDPGNLDLSVRLPLLPQLATDGVDRAAFGLMASAPPLLGITLNLTGTNPTGTSIGAVLVGLADLGPLSPAGFDLGVIGAPGCVANIQTTPMISGLIGNGAGGTMQFAITIPALPALIGQQLFGQALWLDPLLQNQAFGTVGLLTSNALRLTIG